MTHSVQPLTWAFDEKTVRTDMSENIRDALSLCESLNKLCETLNRLDCAIKRKIAETTKKECLK